MPNERKNRWILITSKLEDLDVHYKTIEDNQQDQADWQKLLFTYLVEEYVSLLALIEADEKAKRESSDSES